MGSILQEESDCHDVTHMCSGARTDRLGGLLFLLSRGLSPQSKPLRRLSRSDLKCASLSSHSVSCSSRHSQLAGRGAGLGAPIEGSSTSG
ncbi:unnamed protein product [Gadus morhua 'NCC']